MKSLKRKLSLSRETLRTLEPADLAGAVGARTTVSEQVTACETSTCPGHVTESCQTCGRLGCTAGGCFITDFDCITYLC